jgi:alkylation response protein AidB-like acyl-CoA dehydrogenase
VDILLSSLAKGQAIFTTRKQKTAQPCSGVKQFITGGKNGDVAVVIAIADKATRRRVKKA